MKSFLATICILGMVGIMIGTVAEAGDTVTATVTVGAVSVTVSPTSFDYGTIPFSTTRQSYDTTGDLASKNISATVGTLPTDLDIKGATTTDWTTLAASEGVNTYVHKYSTSSAEAVRPASYVALTTSYGTNHLGVDVAPSGVVWFGLQIITPVSGVATQQSAAVIVQATWHQ